MNKEDFSEEADKLQEIIAKFNEVMEYYNLRLDAIPKIYKDKLRANILKNMIINID